MAIMNRHELDLISEDRLEQAQAMQDRLEKMGVQVSITHYTGDSSSLTEYTLRYSIVQAVGPTMDMALIAFTEQLLKHVPVETL